MRGPDRHRELATPLQNDQAARLNRIQATSTRGVRTRIRRVAGCATPTGSAGHAGATANLKLTSIWTTQWEPIGGASAKRPPSPSWLGFAHSAHSLHFARQAR